MNNNTIGGAGAVIIGYGLGMIPVVSTMWAGLILVGIGSALVVTVALLQKSGLNVTSNIG
jgi:hypothetical protein